MVPEVVKTHVRANVHQAECSGSEVIVHTNVLPYLANLLKFGLLTFTNSNLNTTSRTGKEHDL